jgi:ribonuclease HI
MPCWNYKILEGEYEPDRIICTECGDAFNHRSVTHNDYTYSHRCNAWVELWPGKHAHCALPTHAGECIGEVVTPRPANKNYQAPERKPVRIYTDGGYRGEVGGWGWYNPISKESAFGSEYPSTNQRMELMAAREAIDHYLDEPNLTIISDSAYLINAMTNKWYKRWQSNGWVNQKGQPVANRDLWEALVAFVTENPTIKFEKVKGHSGDEGNDRADQLATKGILDYLMSRRRIDELREMLHAHSYAYYVLGEVTLPDQEWDDMAKRLVQLHLQYPHALDHGYEAAYFKKFDGSTGFDMPWTDYIKGVAEKMVSRKKEVA